MHHCNYHFRNSSVSLHATRVSRMWLRYTCIRNINFEQHGQQSDFCTCVFGGEKYFPDFTVSFDLATFELNSVLKCLYWVTENPDITEEWAVILRGSVSVVHSVFQRTHMAVFLESKCHRWCQQIHAAGQYCIFYHFIFWRKHISVTMVYQHITTVSKRFSECSLSC